MRTRGAALVIAAAVAALTTACADGVTDPDAAATPSPPGAAVTTPETPDPGPPSPTSAPGAPPLSPPASAAPSAKPPPGAETGPVTVTGTVADGVEPGCRLLVVGGFEYLLVVPAGVDDSGLHTGDQVTVRGYLRPDLVTYCQQGRPLVVEEIRSPR